MVSAHSPFGLVRRSNHREIHEFSADWFAEESQRPATGFLVRRVCLSNGPSTRP
jgi:hypothetical protein